MAPTRPNNDDKRYYRKGGGNYRSSGYNSGGRYYVPASHRAAQDAGEGRGQEPVERDQSSNPGGEGSSRGRSSNRGGNNHGNDHESTSGSGRGRSAFGKDQGNTSGSGRNGGRNPSSAGSHRGGNRDPSVAGSRRGGNGQSSNTYSGVKKNQSKKKKPSAVPQMVTEAVKEEVTDGHGRRAWTVKNTSVGGGNNSRFGAPTNLGGNMGVVPTRSAPRDVGFFAQRIVDANPDADGVAFHMEPVRNDLLKAIKRDQVSSRTTHSTGRTKEGKVEALEHPLGGRVTTISHEQGEKCILCGSRSHNMAKCLEAPEDGEIDGCTLCNQEDHLVDECINFPRMSLTQKVDLMVTSRGNMPPLKTQVPWYTLLHEYLMSNEVKAEDIPDAFPWSSKFAMDIAWENRGRRLTGIQKAFDSSGDTAKLPADPSTESLEAIYETFWEPDNHIWPSCLDELASAKPGKFDPPETSDAAADGTVSASRTIESRLGGMPHGFDNMDVGDE